ncbi:hypothetical protein [Desulfovibrio sp. TomC]|uniref:hypothetical protein n=1 Tax=Desulfovibrio sp. TomC TaxID=1562888 RepID=UPI000574EADD|nr:hypothetical protein [Desulfovibrio sp. TomC]KHK00809.1 putative cytosolic protein [Desulfovibrio sp. TomC]
MTQHDKTFLFYLGFDDTDTKTSPKGTGRTIRDFCATLPETYRLHAVLRHQLPKRPEIPYTSNNSSACAVIETDDPALGRFLFDSAAAYLTKFAPEGSDPGVCLAERRDVRDELVAFALACNGGKVSQSQAMTAASGILLAGVGGTNDGLIGAAAAVGLTRHGWCGRFIELGDMRSLPATVTVGDLLQRGIQVTSVDRDPLVPLPGDAIATGGWLRPSLLAGQAVLQVRADGDGRWVAALGKRGDKAA